MTAYRLLVAERAKREATQADSWWRDNRRETPNLFFHELAAALERIPQTPFTGTVVNHSRREVRRWLLRRCQYHLYYSIDEGARTITIRSLWHAARGQRPRLDR